PFSLLLFNDTAPTKFYPLSLHDALPISLKTRYSSLRTGSLPSRMPTTLGAPLPRSTFDLSVNATVRSTGVARTGPLVALWRPAKAVPRRSSVGRSDASRTSRTGARGGPCRASHHAGETRRRRTAS